MPIENEEIGGTNIGHRSQLYRTLYLKLPNHRGDRHRMRLSGKKIADDLNVSYQTVYKWFDKDKLPAKHVKGLIALDGSKLSPEDLLEFVI